MEQLLKTNEFLYIYHYFLLFFCPNPYITVLILNRIHVGSKNESAPKTLICVSSFNSVDKHKHAIPDQAFSYIIVVWNKPISSNALAR